jgi:hypothetical protein
VCIPQSYKYDDTIANTIDTIRGTAAVAARAAGSELEEIWIEMRANGWSSLKVKCRTRCMHLIAANTSYTSCH